MDINKTFKISQKGDGTIETNLNDPNKMEQFDAQHPDYFKYERIITILRKKTFSDEQKDRKLKRTYEQLFQFTEEEMTARLIYGSPIEAGDNEEAIKVLKEALAGLIKFFSEFRIEPSIRFINTLLRTKDKKQYVMNYFTLCDHPAAKEVAHKLKSDEWKYLEDKLKYVPTEAVNKHLVIYEGPAGTGKTTLACSQAKYCIVCSSDMTCKDLLQDFNFEDGKATFKKSDLWLAIENGETIVLDEINLLPNDARQFLQGLTDGKESVDFLGNTIKIHPNFKVIGTMNLVVNGMSFPLSEPLVDRCAEIREFHLTADDLFKAIVETDKKKAEADAKAADETEEKAKKTKNAKNADEAEV